MPERPHPPYLEAFYGISPPGDRIVANLLCSLLVLAITAVDYLTGTELNCSLFYLIPVGVATWYANRLSGLTAAVASSMCWLWSDAASGHIFSTELITGWNLLVRCGVLTVFVQVLARLKAELAAERRLGRIDNLTGALNYRSFREAMLFIMEHPVELGDDRLSWEAMALAYLDLDNFKEVNDRWGHAAGDEVIRNVSALVTRHIRPTDLFARLGGDEFVLALPQGGERSAPGILERLRKALAHYAKESGYPISVSIGVVQGPRPYPPLPELIRQADDLMYRAKHEGKNRIVYAVAQSDG